MQRGRTGLHSALLTSPRGAWGLSTLSREGGKENKRTQLTWVPSRAGLDVSFLQEGTGKTP